MRTLFQAVLLVAMLAPVAALAEGKLVEPDTEIAFDQTPTMDGVAYKCLGAGLRKKVVFKVYAVAFCVEASKADAVVSAAAKAASGKVDADSTAFFTALGHADAAKAVDMRFVRDVDKAKIVEAYSETLQKALGADDAEGKAKFLALVDRDVKSGQRMTLSANTEGLITMTINGHAGTVTDPKIAKAIWVSWLGPDSVAPSLKEDIAKHVQKK
jgi:hypothetical protein